MLTLPELFVHALLFVSWPNEALAKRALLFQLSPWAQSDLIKAAIVQTMLCLCCDGDIVECERSESW